ncbi:MAG: hypothetical protein AB1416_09120 [Actinomycetota bacterium]
MSTRRVTYQAMLDAAEPPAPVFAALEAGEVATRRRDASRKVTVQLSKAQAVWLRSVADSAGKGVDVDAVVRALVDVGQALDVDWSSVSGAGQLRRAVREAVRVRRAPSAGSP